MLTQKMKDELLEYIKADSDDEEAEGLFEAAVRLAETQTGKEFIIEEDQPKDQLYWTAIKQLVCHWYDNRGAIDEKAVNKIPYNAETILNHISLCSQFPKKSEEAGI